jgi:secreted Zn-dependent insulinase-like peptidase
MAEIHTGIQAHTFGIDINISGFNDTLPQTVERDH